MATVDREILRLLADWEALEYFCFKWSPMARGRRALCLTWDGRSVMASSTAKIPHGMPRKHGNSSLSSNSGKLQSPSRYCRNWILRGWSNLLAVLNGLLGLVHIKGWALKPINDRMSRKHATCPEEHSLCHCDSRRIRLRARFGMVVARTAVEVANHGFNDCCRPRTIQSAGKTGPGHSFERPHER